MELRLLAAACIKRVINSMHKAQMDLEIIPAVKARGDDAIIAAIQHQESGDARICMIRIIDQRGNRKGVKFFCTRK